MSMTATLTVMGGLPDQAGQVFEVGPGRTMIGRGLSCDIQLPDQNISRLHAELNWEDDVLVLVHKSGVNRTSVDGTEVADRRVLEGGEEIQFADRVVLRIKIESDSAHQKSPLSSSDLVLVQRPRRKRQRANPPRRLPPL